MTHRGADGCLLVLEGLDGSGTTTQRARLALSLRARGLAVLETWEPTGGQIGLLIRRFLAGELPLDPATVALLFAADRLDHLRSEVRPAVEAGMVVVSDRYVLSSLAYQSSDLDAGWVAAINRLADRPDLTIFLDVSPEECFARVSQRGAPVEHYERLDRLRAVDRWYRRAIDASRLAGDAVTAVDGARPPDEVERDVLAAALSVVARRSAHGQPV